jgi:hypothetical protein
MFIPPFHPELVLLERKLALERRVCRPHMFQSARHRRSIDHVHEKEAQ